MSWHQSTLGDLIEFENGYAFKSDEYTDEGHFLMRIANVQQGCISMQAPKFVSIPQHSNLIQFELNEGDMLMSLTGNVGRVGLIEAHHLPAALNQRVARVKIKDLSKIDKGYLFSFFNTDDTRAKIENLANGAAQLNVSTKDVKSLTIPLPPLAEQQRIAAILDKAAEIKAKREQAIAKLDELAASAFDECCLKSTNQTTTKIKNLVVKRKLTETNDMNVWSLALDQIESNSGKIHSRVMVSKAKLGTSTYYFEPDVVLYSKLRPYLNKVVIPETYGYATTELVPLYCDAGKILPVFMAAYLRSSKFVNFANTNSAGAKMPRVMMDKFWDCEIALPNLGVQRDFQQLIEKCNVMKQSLKDCVDKQEQLIASLQYQAFTTGFSA